MERLLTLAGFQVMSWTAIDDVVAHDNVTPVVAAAQLGAQVLFQVTEMGGSVVRPRSDATMERRFFDSSETGEQGPPAQVWADLGRKLDALAAPVATSLRGQARLSATMGVTATAVPSGVAIWFFRATLPETPSAESYAYLLARCTRAVEGLSCTEVSPVWRARQPPPDQPPGGGSTASLTGRPVDQEAAIHELLMRSLIERLVQAFTSRT